MKLSKLIEEFIDLKMEGEPEGNGWQSIADMADARERYHQKLDELREAIDAHSITSKEGGAA